MGENITDCELRYHLSTDEYTLYKDVILPSSNGTTQIDHIIISKYGIFIIETKNLSGWIFGSKDQKNWTQVLYRKKYSFQNPLKQAFRQKKVLSEFLNIKLYKIHTKVNFVGDCRFKTKLPDDVFKREVGINITEYRKEVFSGEEVITSINKLKNHIETSSLTEKDHIRSLNKRHGSRDMCPRCGGLLAIKDVKNGARAGRQFWGCSKFPVCRYTKSVRI